MMKIEKETKTKEVKQINQKNAKKSSSFPIEAACFAAILVFLWINALANT